MARVRSGPKSKTDKLGTPYSLDFPFTRNLILGSTSDLIWSSLITDTIKQIYEKFNTHLFLLDIWLEDYVPKHYERGGGNDLPI